MCRKYAVSGLGVILLAALAYFYGGSQVLSGQRPLRSLTAENVGEITNEFNAANNEIRFTAALTNLNLMSAGASATQDLIREFGGKPMRAFVVWEPVLPTDWSSPSIAPRSRLPDVRVTQFWDQGRVISHLMGEHDRRSVVWDYIAVYPAGAIWENLPPSSLYHGNPVVQVTDAARAAMTQALAEQHLQIQ